MKLIKQISLEYREGNSDKVYEIDLCEVGRDRYVVNFRYGPRGKKLREGTKTATPVPRSQAEQIFDKLVSSKTQKGYFSVSVGNLQPPVSSVSEQTERAPIDEGKDPRRQAILNRLREGHQSDSKWRLSRAVWRAGELRIKEAEPALLALIGTQDQMLDYCLVWSLGQCGSTQSLATLRNLTKDKKCPEMVRRIARLALLQLIPTEERQQTLTNLYSELPEPVAELARKGPAQQLQETLASYLAEVDYPAFAVLETLYLIDNEHTRPTLLQVLRTAPLEPNYFQRIRHIFKAAEMIHDAETFGLIAYRIETTPAMFRMPESWYFRQREKPTVGPDAERAFSVQTRYYFRRRIWRTLRRLAKLADPEYVRLAAGVLAPFTDGDGQSPRKTVQYDYTNYWKTRKYRTITTHFDRFANYWAFNQILYGNSPRYGPDAGRRFFACKGSYKPGDKEPAEREESFPHLWEQQPEVVLDLISRSRCEPVHRFAVKVLRVCEKFCREMPIESLMVLLRASYQVSAELGFELAVARYNPDQLDTELILALANCAFQRARRQAHQWIIDQQTVLLQNNEFLVSLVVSPYSDTRTFARDLLRQATLSEAESQALIGRLFASLQNLDNTQGELASDIVDTLLRVFHPYLRKIGPEVIRDLLAHPLPEIQQFAGDLVLGHDTLSKNPPADVIHALLSASHQGVRGMGVRIIGQLPEEVLKNSLELLVALTRHQLEDVRQAIRPVVARLAQSEAEFGQKIAARLLDELLIPGAPEGVPTHTARVLREDLRAHLSGVSAEMVWRLLQSRSAPAQEVGGDLLATNVRLEDLSVEAIVKLGHHEILSVREACWKMCNAGVDQLRTEPEVAVKLIDSRWEDTRQFAFRFFRDNFSEDGVLSPSLLIGICDSIRPDVQQFGREMITRVFAEDHGEEYVLKLSEHPTESMQLFASNFLEQHAQKDPAKLQQLSPYFVSVLSQVNKGRVAKSRVFRFLEREAMKSETAAEVVAEILTRQSATVAIGDKAHTIEIMTKIHEKYPAISLPIQVQPVKVRGGV